MKKLYFLFLMCFISFVTYGQQTVMIWDSAAVGMYKSGHVSMTFRFDDTIKASLSPDLFRGWAVFDLAAVPPNATVTRVEFGYYLIDTQWAAGAPLAWQVYGVAGDLSGVTSPAVLGPATIAGSPLWNTDFIFGSSPTPSFGTRSYVGVTSSTAAAFIQTQAGNKVTLTFAGGDATTYKIMGESGYKSTDSDFHAPYLKVTYTCANLSTVTSSGAPDTLCEYTPLTLTAFAPSAFPVTYSWTGPNNFTATGSPATAIADTTGYYVAIARNSVGCFYRDTTDLITVRNAPDAIITNIGDTTFCVGGSVTLDATTPTVVTDTFEWFLNGAAIPGATNPTFNATTTGNYTVRITNIRGCKNTSRPMQVLALASPNILPGGAISACTGGSLLLSISTGGGIGGLNFQWKRNGANIPGATNSSYPVSTSGNYAAVVSIISDPTCTYNVPPTVVSIFPVPNPVITNTGGTFATPNLYSTYQWYLNSIAIPGATSYLHTPTINGSYNLRITDYNGCSNYSNTLVVGNAGVRVQEFGETAVSIFPNPAKNIVKIEAPVAVRAVICGMEGKTILEKANATELNISHLPDGMYLIYVYGGDGKKLAVQKLVKQ